MRTTRSALETMASENLPLGAHLRRWVIFAMMSKRRITWREIGEVMGVSYQRAHQLWERSYEDRIMDRLEDAIQKITARRHAEAGHTDEDPLCAIYTAEDPEDPSQPRAKARAFREYYQLLELAS